MEAFIWKRKKLNKNYQLTEFSREAKTNSPAEVVWATVLAAPMEWDLLTTSMVAFSALTPFSALLLTRQLPQLQPLPLLLLLTEKRSVLRSPWLPPIFTSYKQNFWLLWNQSLIKCDMWSDLGLGHVLCLKDWDRLETKYGSKKKGKRSFSNESLIWNQEWNNKPESRKKKERKKDNSLFSPHVCSSSQLGCLSHVWHALWGTQWKLARMKEK